jgi:hypothetical protein
MTVAKIPINVPEPLYRRLQRISALAQRSVEEILTSAVTVALPPSPDLPNSVADELAEMMWLSDEALWAATTPTFTAEQQSRLSALNDLEDTRSLQAEEQQAQAQLLAAYERSVLRRAQAFAILARRGHQIPPLKNSSAAS